MLDSDWQEIYYESYQRTPVFMIESARFELTNVNDVSFPLVGQISNYRDWLRIAGMGLYTLSGTLVIRGDLATSKVIVPGDSFKIPAKAFVVRIDDGMSHMMDWLDPLGT